MDKISKRKKEWKHRGFIDASKAFLVKKKTVKKK